MAVHDTKFFQVHPHHRDGAWESNDGRYREYAHTLLAELEALSQQVIEAFKEAGAPASADSNVQTIGRLRDRTSDTTRIFAAMAIEGFLNFYGVLRLGQAVYTEHFERLGLIPKIRQLLLVCDNLDVPKNHPLCKYAEQVAQSRNSLVHPKAREVLGDPRSHKRSATPVPGAAREVVQAMEDFFAEFSATVPDAREYIDRLKAA